VSISSKKEKKNFGKCDTYTHSKKQQVESMLVGWWDIAPFPTYIAADREDNNKNRKVTLNLPILN